MSIPSKANAIKTYGDEMKEIRELTELGSLRTTSGNTSYTSATSFDTYDTSASSDPNILNRGEDGLLYLLNSTFNENIIDVTYLNEVNKAVVESSLIYGADVGSSDSYAISLPIAPTAYTSGMMINFKANTANTGACSLNVNALSAKTIKDASGNDLFTGAIIGGQIVNVIYDGTNFIMVSAPTMANLALNQNMSQNGFINGDFQVWQMGTSIVPAAANKYYTADMWQINRYASTTGLVCSQVAYESSVAKNALRVQRTAGDTALNAFFINYFFPASDSPKYIGKKVTVSFSVRIGANTAGVFKARILSKTGAESGNAGDFTTIKELIYTPTTTEQIIVLTSDVVASTITQMGCQFTYTPSTATAGANDYIEITNCNWSATDFYVPFSPKSFADELQDCMTYYEKSYAYATAPATNTTTGAVYYSTSSNASNNVRIYIPYKVKKRTTPTNKFYLAAGTADLWNYERNGATGTAAITDDHSNDNAIVGYIGIGAAWIVGLIYGHWVADARI